MTISKENKLFMQNKALCKLLSIFLAFTFIFTGCSTKGTSQNTGTDANTFIYGIESDPGDNINAITTANRMGMMILKATYSPLFSYTEQGTNWYLANDVSVSEDMRTYTFSLKENVTWNDGEPFTADDVVFTFHTMLATPNGWANEQLTFGDEQITVEKTSEYEVTITFPAATPAAMELLSNIFIMPKHIYEGETDIDASEYNKLMIGTGPYILEEYKPGEYFQFKANPNYFGGEAQIENLVFRILPDSASARLALQKGEIHALTAQATDMEELQDTSNLSIYPYSEGRVAYLVFNTTHEYMQNVDLRKAIMYSLHKEEINLASYMSTDYYTSLYTFLPSGNPYTSTDDVLLYEQDLEAADELYEKALQEESLSKDEMTLKLAYWGANVPQQRQALVIQQQLQAAGITVEITGLEPNALDMEMQSENSEYDMFLGGYICGIDPSMYADMFVSGSVYNYSHIQNETIDDLFTQIALETDEEVRYALVLELQQTIQEEGFFYPLADNKRILVIQSNIGGVDDSGLVPVYTIEDYSKLYFI